MTEPHWDDKPSLDILAHHGVKGMHWGTRKELPELKPHGFSDAPATRATRKSQDAFEKLGKKEAQQDKKQFKADVKATHKGQGFRSAVNQKSIDGTYVGPKNEETSLFSTGKDGFVNTKGEKVSDQYANHVLSKTVQREDRARMIQLGTLFTAAYLVAKAHH